MLIQPFYTDIVCDIFTGFDSLPQHDLVLPFANIPMYLFHVGSDRGGSNGWSRNFSTSYSDQHRYCKVYTKTSTSSNEKQGQTNKTHE